ncbi:hypothetical protein SAMN05421736_111147 [Evansella caseinilytica]|uniref:Cas10/Cmr2 second palm domain-containing protein n=1 Tax=Evansella caseinilytica TaxID=1503961 RepID=A0A1H3SPR8_9BACI|nr:hypothetical protein [Evansella caseinilytica]SDZ39541.1 hypothetical protein SAMN05421736_111147 [Evansella caseinilytica]
MDRPTNQLLLAAYDISGIQEYIFASNRLKENIGGSYIVGTMMRTHLPKVLKQLSFRNEGKVITNWEEAPFRLLDDSIILAEIIYIGGGNALVMYRDWGLYHQVNKQFSLELIKESFTLTLATEAIAFSPSDGTSYSKLVKELMNKLDTTKSELIRSKPLGALPISSQERFGGWPVTTIDEHANHEEISTVQALKRKAATEKPLQELFPLDNQSFSWAKEMEAMKRKKGEDSYVAVVHIDGNGMGQLLRQKLYSLEKESLTKQISEHRELSKQITSRYLNYFQNMIADLEIADLEIVDLTISQGGVLPIRPLIMDGDDITFICRADWGIPLAMEFLRRLEMDTEQPLPLSACAGVALVHSHFPFQIAYEIAEECCKNAKKKYYQEMQGSFLDFHLVRGSYVLSRKEQLELGLKNKQQRPFRVNGTGDLNAPHSIDLLAEVIQKMKLDPEEAPGAWPRSWLVRLYQAYLQHGKNDKAVTSVIEEAVSRGYDRSYFFSETETIDDSVLFDALEVLDSYEHTLFQVKEGKQ